MQGIYVYMSTYYLFYFILFFFRSKSTKRTLGVRNLRSAFVAYAAYAKLTGSTKHTRAKTNRSRSIKTSLNHYFSIFWRENLNLIEDTWQTQHKRSQTYALFGQKNRHGQKKNIVSRSLTRTQIKRRQKSLRFKNGNVEKNVR